MNEIGDSGQIKFWQVALIIALIAVVLFDVGSPHLTKVQIKDKADQIALDESQSYQRASRTNASQAYASACDRVVRAIEDSGARFIPPEPDVNCPLITQDGRVSFAVEKTARCLILCRVGLRNYFTVRVDISERYGGGSF